MWKVDIYLEADSKAQKNTERKCAYILETICAGAIKTAEGFQCISGTYHSATLQNLVAALSRIRKTSNVCVHTEDVYVVSRIRKLPEMAAANWEDARGTRIGNAELWKRIWELIEEHRLTLTAKAGNTYSQVTVDDYTFRRTFRSTDVMYIRPNWKNVNTVLKGLYGSYARLIQYGAKSFLQSHGSKGILNISSIASNAKNFDETLKKLLNEYFKTFFESENAVLPIFDGYTFTETNRSKNYNETTTRDIKAMYDDVFDFTARAIGIPPSILKGDVQDNSKATEKMD